MTVTIKTPAQQEKMRIAGRLAASEKAFATARAQAPEIYLPPIELADEEFDACIEDAKTAMRWLRAASGGSTSAPMPPCGPRSRPPIRALPGEARGPRERRRGREGAGRADASP
mgnify:CR=1 FL=1